MAEFKEKLSHSSRDFGGKHESRDKVKRKSSDNADIASRPAKMSFSLGSSSQKSKSQPVKPVKLALGVSSQKIPQVSKSAKLNSNKKSTVAAAFNQDNESEEEEEEMPAEAKMRMRNLGKDTPVPAGPNSFGKGKLGFSHDYRMYERKLLEKIGDPDEKK